MSRAPERDAPRSPRRLTTYLGSAKNITGCLFGLVGLVLYFTGVIEDVWILVVPALYLAGALIAPARPARTLFGGALDPGGVRASLKRLQRDIHAKVPREIETRVAVIAKTIEGILPRAERLTPGSQDVFILQRTATDYLPTTLRTYMDLPREYADTRPVQDGRTARQILTGQLDLLSEQMDEVASAVNRNDVDRLLAHERFLEERFGQSGLSIDGEDPPDVDGPTVR